MKAKYSGECQICGRNQKLPNELLSNHGYSVDYGFFSGICQGAKYQPFEKSCDLIAGVVEQVKVQIQTVKDRIKSLENNLHNTKNVRIQIYCPIIFKYRSIRVDVIGRDNGFGAEEYFGVTEKGEEHKISHYGYGGIKAVTEKLWNAEIRESQSQVRGMEQYVVWQNKRMANWKPKELKEIEAKE